MAEDEPVDPPASDAAHAAWYYAAERELEALGDAGEHPTLGAVRRVRYYAEGPPALADREA